MIRFIKMFFVVIVVILILKLEIKNKSVEQHIWAQMQQIPYREWAQSGVEFVTKYSQKAWQWVKQQVDQL